VLAPDNGHHDRRARSLQALEPRRCGEAMLLLYELVEAAAGRWKLRTRTG
jgi:hypothetical protein